jgi:hypothetical protein
MVVLLCRLEAFSVSKVLLIGCCWRRKVKEIKITKIVFIIRLRVGLFRNSKILI